MISALRIQLLSPLTCAAESDDGDTDHAQKWQQDAREGLHIRRSHDDASGRK